MGLNQEQVTTGKSRLKGQIKELERQLVTLETVRRQHAELSARTEELESLAKQLVSAALRLAQLLTESA